MQYNEHKPSNEYLDSLPPAPAYHILFNLVDIAAIPEPLLTIFSVIQFEDIISGNITATIFDHLPQFLIISPNTFADPPSNKYNTFERDWSSFDQ